MRLLKINFTLYYSPAIGRFLQVDPIGYQGGINLYTYVDNNPINWADPFGLDKQKKDEWWKWGPENWLWQILYGNNVLMAEPGETWELYFARFRATYPYQFAASETFGVYGLGGWIISSGVKGAETTTAYAASRAFSSIGRGNWTYQVGYHQKLLLNQAKGGLTGASHWLLGITIGATSYRFGLQINAWASYRLTHREY